jgi:hypothetical protein
MQGSFVCEGVPEDQGERQQQGSARTPFTRRMLLQGNACIATCSVQDEKLSSMRKFTTISQNVGLAAAGLTTANKHRASQTPRTHVIDYREI